MGRNCVKRFGRLKQSTFFAIAKKEKVPEEPSTTVAVLISDSFDNYQSGQDHRQKGTELIMLIGLRKRPRR